MKTKESAVSKVKKIEGTQQPNHIYHIRPGVHKNVERMRINEFENELIQFETGEFTYLTDPTRYRFRSTPPWELVTHFIPSILLLAIMLATFSCFNFLTNEYTIDIEFNEMSEMTLSKYDSYRIVDSTARYLRNETIFREFNCPGLLQGPYTELDEHELAYLKSENPDVKKAMKALTFRWMSQVEAVMNMNFECPPSVIVQLNSPAPSV